jgi:hypothetical protein
MYLEARKYVQRYNAVTPYDQHEAPTPSIEYGKITQLFPDGADKLGDYAGAEIKITVGYWRKANAIHNWFVTKCAGGKDECQPIFVDSEKLLELRTTCEALLKIENKTEAEAKVKELLPPTAGFFFGSTEIDQFFWQDIRRTLEILEVAIPLVTEESCDIIYQASW